MTNIALSKIQFKDNTQWNKNLHTSPDHHTKPEFFNLTFLRKDKILIKRNRGRNFWLHLKQSSCYFGASFYFVRSIYEVSGGILLSFCFPLDLHLAMHAYQQKQESHILFTLSFLKTVFLPSLLLAVHSYSPASFCVTCLISREPLASCRYFVASDRSRPLLYHITEGLG